MRTIAAGLIVLILTCLSTSCTKNLSGDESDLYGTWIKGSNLGDTLWFSKKNEKNIVRMRESFNPNFPPYSDKEYRFDRGVLNIKLYPSVSQDFFPITSFSWTEKGKEFTLLSVELYSFLSSMVTYKYKKI